MKKPFAGAARVVVLDNLREGVLAPDIDDSTLNPGVLRHYGAVARPSRVAVIRIERKKSNLASVMPRRRR